MNDSSTLILENQVVIMEVLQAVIVAISKGLIPDMLNKELSDACIKTEAYLRAIS